MARYNSSSGSTTINGATTISTPNQGAFTNLTGTAPYTVTLPSPGLFPGSNQTFYNATAGTVTLSTPSGSFSGTGASGTSTNTIFTGNVLSVTSDGTNYIVISEDGSPLIATTGSFSSDVTITGASATVNIQPSSLTVYPGSIGAMDRVAIGVNNRSTGAFTTLAANAQVSFTAGTASSSTGTGSLVVTGGIGASGNIWSGGTVNASSVVATGLTGTLQTAAQANITSLGTITSLSAGTISATGAITSTSNAPFSLQSNGNTGTYAQTVIYNNQNNTSGDSANGIFIERGRVTESASGEIRNFVIGARGGQIQLLVNKDGNIGLTGFTSPAYTLDFGATRPNYKGLIRTYGTGNFFTGIGMDTTTAGIRIAGDNAGGNLITDFGWYTNDASQTWTSLLKILGNGNVGIGTNVSPAAKLSLIDEDGGQAMLQIRNYNTSATGAFANTYTAEIRGASSGTQLHGTRIHLEERNDDRRTLDVSDYNGIFASFVNGKVGIGTVLPSYKLQVSGTTYFDTSIHSRGSEFQHLSASYTAPGGGPREIFRVPSSWLCTNGIFSLSATRGSFVHGSMWAWTTTHNGAGQGTLTMLSSGTYSNVTVYLDVTSDGAATISVDWGASEGYQVTILKMAGGALDLSQNGSDWTTVQTSRTRYSRTTLNSGFRANTGAFDGSLSKGSGTFCIDHPLPELEETHNLVHSFIEGPQADLIYRGCVDLVNGSAKVNIDDSAGMTEGTFEALCRDVQCFTTNESDWTAVRGSVTGNVLTIEAESNTATSMVSWMVIGERKDKHMIDTGWTDSNGKPILEPLKMQPGASSASYPEDVTIFQQPVPEDVPVSTDD
jgi:hypothetical protein